MSTFVQIRCDGCGGDLGIPHAGASGPLVRLQQSFQERGWHRQPGNTDVCGECWAEGVRVRVVAREIDGRTIRNAELYRLRTDITLKPKEHQ
jgi:hypothetical protein